jgi:predicted dehydrogenase
VHYNFRFFWDFAGGQMTNWGAHHIDIAQWGLGMDDSGPVTVEGVGDFSHKALYDVPSAVDLTYTYANGVTMHVSMKERGGTKFVGDKGWIWVNRGKNEASDPEILKTVLAPDAVHLYASKNHHANWTDCIRSRKLPICDVEIGHRSATACHLGNLAMRLGRKLTWDPVKEQFVGDDEADKMMAYVYRAPFKMP